MAGKTSGRIISAKNTEDVTALAAAIYKKHLADGTSSFLNQLEGAQWSDVGPTIQAVIDQNKLAQQLKSQMEAAFRLRDRMLAPVAAINTASKQLLKGKYAANPKKLGEWGFSVDDTPPRPRAKKSARAGG